jgi:hypothetical protein
MIVLETTQAVMHQARLVRIDDDAMRRWAEQTPAEALRLAGGGLMDQLPGDREQAANLVLLIDALNFCFWSREPIHTGWCGRTFHRFNAMLASIIRAATDDPRWFDPHFWLVVPRGELRSILAPAGELLMLDEREQIVRETARLLIERFDGRFSAAVESVNRRAWDLAVLLLVSFDSFRDVAAYHDQPVYFAKRAQICAMDLSLAWQARGDEPLDGLDHLTAFADYRVPQVLRHLGILRLSPDMEAAIERGEEIAVGSEPEIELRAATVQAVEAMRRALADRGVYRPAWQIDCHLWERSHDADVSVAHHRTRTVFY